MTLKSKVTGKILRNITDETWSIMKKRGDDSKYTIVNDSEVPEEVKKISYKDIILEANRKFDEGRFEEALEDYEKADKIKSSKTLKSKIQAAKDAIKNLPTQENDQKIDAQD